MANGKLIDWTALVSDLNLTMYERFKIVGDRSHWYAFTPHGLRTGIIDSVGYRYLMTLRDRGVIVYSGKDTLSIEGQERMRPAYRRVPILGGIPCGIPDEHTELVEGYVALPEEWLFGDCYLLRAEGDSMTGAGIDDGDLVLIRKTTISETGRVVVALVDGTDTTLKRYFVEKDGTPVLRAENAKYRDIKPFHLAVQGVAVKVIKDLY